MASLALRAALLLGTLALGSAGAQSEAGTLSLSLGESDQPAATADNPPQAAGGMALQRTESVSVPGGPRSNPSAPQLLDRAQYWEDHGRGDLAARIRGRLPQDVAAPAPPPATALPLATAPQAVPTAGARAIEPQLSPQALEQEAHYWEAHGRDDLADKIRQRLQALSAAPQTYPAPVVATAPLRPAAAPAPSTVPEPRPSNASAALENSLQKEPGNGGTRLDLVQIYRSTGELAKARAQVDSVLAATPDLPAALFASAQLYADQRLWRETLDTLEKIVPVARTAPMAQLQKMAWAHVQLDRADALVKEGHNAEAEVLLRQVALELSIAPSPAALAEPPPLWKPAAAKPSGKRKR